jgi:HK97 family phage major capsid protein
MSLEETNERMEKMGNAWEHYKSVNDERLRQMESKGSADALVLGELEKINNSLDGQKSRIDHLEMAPLRPTFENKSMNGDDNYEYKAALHNYLKKGVEANLVNLEQKSDLTSAMDTGSAYGGYLLNPNMQRLIATEINNSCFLRRICAVQNIGSSALELIDSTDFDASWLSETGSVEDSNSATLTKITIATHELVAQPKVSQKLVDDASVDLEEWLSYKLAEQFSQKEENAFLNGTGDEDNQPKGILTSPLVTLDSTGGSVRSFEATDIVDLYYLLEQKYVGKAVFVMPREAIAKVRMLKDSTSGAYLWQPALLGGKEDTLLGSPVYASSFMPAVAENSLSILFGDFKYYQIVDRNDIRILRDPYTAKPYIRFYTTKRVGGGVVRNDAFVALKCSC